MIGEEVSRTVYKIFYMNPNTGFIPRWTLYEKLPYLVDRGAYRDLAEARKDMHDLVVREPFWSVRLDIVTTAIATLLHVNGKP